MNSRQHAGIHRRWMADLSAELPRGVPLEDDATPAKPWPATFGDYGPDGLPIHLPQSQARDGYLMQCEACRFFVPLTGPLGMDWGACTNAASQYDRELVFEHWTCTEFRR